MYIYIYMVYIYICIYIYIYIYIFMYICTCTAQSHDARWSKLLLSPPDVALPHVTTSPGETNGWGLQEGYSLIIQHKQLYQTNITPWKSVLNQLTSYYLLTLVLLHEKSMINGGFESENHKKINDKWRFLAETIL